MFDNNKLHIKGRIKLYPYLVVGKDKNIYQLGHCSNKRTLEFRQLKYYKERNAYGYRCGYISKKRLLNLYYDCDELIKKYV